MSLNRVISVGALVAAACALTGFLLSGHLQENRRESWDTGAIRATFEMVVPAHNDASFRYVLENRTASDYRIADKSAVRIVERSKSAGESMPKVSEHISGEFPLWVPAGRKVHFALVWTADQDIDPARLDDFVSSLNIRSFVLFDNKHRYQIEFSTSR